MVMVVVGREGFQRVVVVFQLCRMGRESEVVCGVSIGARVQCGHHVQADQNDCAVWHESAI